MLAAVWVAVAIGYLVGSIPVAGLVARRHGVPDLRVVGDGNPGYWNAATLLGRRAAAPVFVGDVAKGAVAAGLAAAIDASEWWMPVLGAGAAMVGHAWPLFAGFRGGRAVLTFVGGALVISPLTAALAIVAAAAAWAGTRRFEWGARVGVFGYPVIQLVVDGAQRTAATGVLMTLIGVRFAQARVAARRTVRATSASS